MRWAMILLAAAGCAEVAEQGAETRPGDKADHREGCGETCPDGTTCEAGVCTGADLAALALDVRTVAVTLATNDFHTCTDLWSTPTATLTQLGVAKPNRYSIYLHTRPTTGFETRVVPGVYRIELSDGCSSGRRTLFAAEPLLVDTALDAEVALPVQIFGTVATDPAITTCRGTKTFAVRFEDDAHGAMYWTTTCTSHFSLKAPPGTYRVVGADYDQGHFANAFLIAAAHTVDAPRRDLSFSVEAVPVTAELTIGGQRRDCSVLHGSQVSFKDALGTSTFGVECVNGFWGVNARLRPGTYEVRIDHVGAGTYTGQPSLVLDRALSIAGPTSALVLDAPVTVPVELALGGTIDDDCKSFFGVTFTDTLTGDKIRAPAYGYCGAWGPLAASTELPAGTYRVTADGWLLHDFVLDEAMVIAPPAGAIHREIALDRVAVAGKAAIAGAPPSVCNVAARAIFRDARGKTYPITMTCRADGMTYAGRLPRGSYDAAVSVYSDGWSGEWIAARGLVIDVERKDLDLTATPIEVRGTLSLNGGPLGREVCDFSSVRMKVVDRDTGFEVPLAGACSWSDTGPTPFAGKVNAGVAAITAYTTLGGTAKYFPAVSALRLGD